jgi:ATP-binding cassette subfamily B (MDR/TAP) protein 1
MVFFPLFRFAGRREALLLAVGSVAAVISGLVYPALALIYGRSFQSLSGAATGDTSTIYTAIYSFLIAGFVSLVAIGVQTICYEQAAQKMTSNLRERYFTSILRQDMAFFDSTDVAQLPTLISGVCFAYRRSCGTKFAQGIQFTTMSIGGLAVAFYSSWEVTLVSLAVIPLLVFSAMLLVNVNQNATRRTASDYALAGGLAYTVLVSLKTVLSLNASPHFMSLYKRYTASAKKRGTNRGILIGCANGGLLGSMVLMYLVLTLYGTYLLYRNVRSTGCDPSGAVENNDTCSPSAANIFTALLGVAFAGQGGGQVGTFIESTSAGSAALKTATDTIDRPVFIDSAGNFEAGRGGASARVVPTIEFLNVSFAYPARPDKLILDNFNMTVPAGTNVALVGPSGCGKSTVIQLLNRYYDVNKGEILVDGINIKQINVHELRAVLSLVSQEPVLFNRSIRENIAFGHSDPSGCSLESVKQAAQLAQCDEFINLLPDQYDTMCGEGGGSQMSGGERQRICIARALVNQPVVLCCDEATSALDVEYEAEVQRAIDGVLSASESSAIIIAHRLSTLRNIDEICVLDQGRVVERGTHEYLRNSGGLFQRLWAKQQGTQHSAQPPAVTASRTSPDTTTIPHIAFDAVSFTYPSRNKRVLNNFDISIKKGTVVALVGQSGSGKSTVISLLERFYDPLKGSIRIDAVDIRTMDVTSLRRQIALVSQEVKLFPGTLAQNVALGMPDASFDEIVAACTQANAHDFISGFPLGYATQLGETTQLSGGQRQRVGLARALLREPKILLLDEPTSALDSESEDIVLNTISEIVGSGKMTVVLVSHRLSTIALADVVVVLKNGVAFESGHPDELAAMPDSQYAAMLAAGTMVGLLGPAKEYIGEGDGIEEEDEEEAKKEEAIQESSVRRGENEDTEMEGKEFRRRCRKLIQRSDIKWMALMILGAVLAGLVFPFWGWMFALMILLIFRPIFECPLVPDGGVPFDYDTCPDYLNAEADDMQSQSYAIAGYWAGIVCAAVVGNVLVFYAGGVVAERISKRVRDKCFRKLLELDPEYHDTHEIGFSTGQLSTDATKLKDFSLSPVRDLVVALSSVLVGVTLSFVFMWPTALIGVVTIPIMAFASSIEMKQHLGTGDDSGSAVDDAASSANSSNVLAEALANIRTVLALQLQNKFRELYMEANVTRGDCRAIAKTGLLSGISMFIQQAVNALQFWVGYELITTHPDSFGFLDFLVAMFALLFSLFGLSSALQGLDGRKSARAAAVRVFRLLDLKPTIARDESQEEEDT